MSIVEEERKGERRIDDNWCRGQPLRRNSPDRRKVIGKRADRIIIGSTIPTPVESTITQRGAAGARTGECAPMPETAKVRNDQSAPLPDLIDALLAGVPEPIFDVPWVVLARIALREAVKALRTPASVAPVESLHNQTHQIRNETMNEKINWNETMNEKYSTGLKPTVSPSAINISGANTAGRMSARTQLLFRVTKLRDEAAKLEALARAIPDNFPKDADSALLHLINSQRW